MMKHSPFLFDMNHDQDESYNVATHFPEKEEELREKLKNKREVMENNPRGWK